MEPVIFDGLTESARNPEKGKSGGVGLLLKRLACLLLNIELPKQYNRPDLEEQNQLDEVEETVRRMESFPLEDLEESDFYHPRTELLHLLKHEKDPFPRFRATYLLGRIDILKNRFRG
jgi:hypothetical protein